MKQNTLRNAILGLAMAAGFAFTVQPGLAQSADAITGTWLATVTIDDCNKNPVFSFPIMYTFLKEGAVISTAGLPGQGPLQGSWEIAHGSGNRQFTGSFWVFTFNPDGSWFGMNKIAVTGKLSNDGKQFTSTAAVQLFDGNGNQVGSGCATEAARRL